MRIVILHHDLERSEEKLQELLVKEGITPHLIDIRKASLKDFSEANIVMNRVYASVANRDFPSIEKTLSLLKTLEERGIQCLNSYTTSIYDYNKYKSYVLMKSYNLPTPATLFLDTTEDIDMVSDEAERHFGLPLVIKRNTGGRGKDISKVSTKEECIRVLRMKFESAEKENYRGGFVVQEFIKPSRNHDCRVCIWEGEFLYSFGRTLIPYESEDKWLASISRGSLQIDYLAEEPEIKICIEACELLGAQINEIDVAFNENGPVIIENNPTPTYNVDDPRDVDVLKKYVRGIIARSGLG